MSHSWLSQVRDTAAAHAGGNRHATGPKGPSGRCSAPSSASRGSANAFADGHAAGSGAHAAHAADTGDDGDRGDRDNEGHCSASGTAIRWDLSGEAFWEDFDTEFTCVTCYISSHNYN